MTTTRSIAAVATYAVANTWSGGFQATHTGDSSAADGFAPNGVRCAAA